MRAERVTEERKKCFADVDGGDPAFKVLRRYTVAETPTWAHLAVVGDGILVKDAGSLAYLRF